MRVLVTRPKEDAQGLIKQLTEQGIETLSAPLLTIQYIPGPMLNTDGVQAILFTSMNGVRAFVRRSSDRAVKALCVGGSTAQEASNAGFSSVQNADGDVQDLARLVKTMLRPGEGVLLHPAATDLAGDLATQVQQAGFTYRREVLYTAVRAKALSPKVCAAIKEGTLDGVVLFSPRTGATFSRLIVDAGLESDVKKMTAYCLSPRVADNILGLSWKDVKIASHPQQNALLALL